MAAGSANGVPELQEHDFDGVAGDEGRSKLEIAPPRANVHGT